MTTNLCPGILGADWLTSFLLVSLLGADGAAAQAPDARAEFAAWPNLQPDELVFGRDDGVRDLAERYDSATCRALLDDADGHVRAVALAVLFQREGTGAVPELLAHLDDEGPAPVRTLLSAIRIDPQPVEPQSVGRFAVDVFRASLGSHGIRCDHDDPEMRACVRDWLSAHKDHVHSLVAWQVEFDRTGARTSRVSEVAAARVRALRARLDALPLPERAWYLLALVAGSPEAMADGNNSGRNVIASESELVRIAGELGPGALLALLDGRGPDTLFAEGSSGGSDDPDLALAPASWMVSDGPFPYDDVVEFVLAHAAELLPRASLGELERVAARHLAGAGSPPSRTVLSALWFTARADLAPERAQEMVQAGFAQFDGQYDSRERRRLVESALEHLGPGGASLAVEWLYTESSSQGPGDQHMFLQTLYSAQRRSLLVDVLADARLGDLDPWSLFYLAHAVNVHRPEAPPFDDYLYSRFHLPISEQHYAADRAAARAAFLAETAKYEAQLGELVAQLRAQAAELQER